MPGRTDFSFSFGDAAPQRLEPDEPLRLVVLGDFSGRASRGIGEPLEGRRVLSVDIDNLDGVLEEIEPRLVLPSMGENGGSLSLTFATLEDFHPDKLLAKLGQASRLLALRKEMSDAGKSAAAIAELRSLLEKPSIAPAEVAPGGVPAERGAETDTATLERLLGGAPAVSSADRQSAVTSPTRPGATPPTGGKPDLSGLFRQAAQGSSVAAATPEQEALGSAVELQVQRALCAVLHSAQFQALEAAWRSLEFLVRRAGGDERVKLLVVDCTKAEIAADPQGLARLVVRSAEHGAWGAWTGLFRFDPEEADFKLLAQLSALAGHVRAPFFAEGAPSLAGCDDFTKHPYPEDWKGLQGPARDLMDALQRMPDAKWLGLALPRFLLRLPYGKGSQEIDSFGFEEMSSPPAHAEYLWGSPGVVCLGLVADSFLDRGWDMDLNGTGLVGELPMHRYREDGEKVMKPCAEAWLSDRTGEALLARGFIPVLSVKNSDSVQVYKLRSVAKEPGLVAGKWSFRD